MPALQESLQPVLEIGTRSLAFRRCGPQNQSNTVVWIVLSLALILVLVIAMIAVDMAHDGY
jgi:hypothetical protein